MVYMLTAFINPVEGSLRILENSPTEGKDWGFVPISAVLPEALNSFKLASHTESPLTAFRIIRKLLNSSTYLKTRQTFHSRFIVPETLKELEDYYQFKYWAKETIGLSPVKGTQRIIYRSKKNLYPISIAQTQRSNGTIRETELIIAREDLSQQFDFYAYNEKGFLTQTSLFQSQNGKEVQASVPYTCLTCHYDSHERTFQTSPSSYSRPKYRHQLFLEKR